MARNRYGGSFNERLKELLETQWIPQEKIKQLQFASVKDLLEFSYKNVPYYTKLFDEHGLKPAHIKQLSDLEKIPLLTKKIIRENFEDLIASNVKRSDIKLSHSSGTTGQKLFFYLPKILKYQINYAVNARFYNWAGIKPFDKRVTLGGRLFTKHHPYWIYNRAENQLLLSIHHLNSETVDSYIEMIEKFSPKFIAGHPSGVDFIAQRLVNTHKTLPLKAIFTTGETLTDEQRQVIKKGFGVDVFDTWGLGESVASASECEYHEGYHEDSEYGIIEFIKTEKGYEIVGTSLYNYAMPFIRYKIEDIAELIPDGQQVCKCGRGLPLKFRRIIGRNDDQLTGLNGKNIFSVTVRMNIKPFLMEGETYQLIQTSKKDFTFKIASSDFNPDRNRAFNNMLLGILGDKASINIEVVNEIHHDGGGKLRNVVNLTNK
ncbi:MAG: hypothetical protein PHY02_04040 [Phycisphaerae bacterium]|nr:hypothetical protein [Phycisphaerae bacterium]